MTVYVDELRTYPNAPRCFRWGACHMTTDGHIEELLAFSNKGKRARKAPAKRKRAPKPPRHPLLAP